MFKQRSGLLEFPTRNVDVSQLAKQIVIIRGLNESSAQGRLTAGTVIEIFAPEDLPERAVELLLREMFAPGSLQKIESLQPLALVIQRLRQADMRLY